MTLLVSSSIDLMINLQEEQVEILFSDNDDFENDNEELEDVELKLFDIVESNFCYSKFHLEGIKNKKKKHSFKEQRDSNPIISKIYSPPEKLI
jgi:hypothetical protein